MERIRREGEKQPENSPKIVVELFRNVGRSSFLL
jgi:hypothetical protein